jgi:hypothetical protein
MLTKKSAIFYESDQNREKERCGQKKKKRGRAPGCVCPPSICREQAFWTQAPACIGAFIVALGKFYRRHVPRANVIGSAERKRGTANGFPLAWRASAITTPHPEKEKKEVAHDLF